MTQSGSRLGKTDKDDGMRKCKPCCQQFTISLFCMKGMNQAVNRLVQQLVHRSTARLTTHFAVQQQPQCSSAKQRSIGIHWNMLAKHFADKEKRTFFINSGCHRK
ncbi:hypothetical protein D3C85_1492960 [compost metagenome]